MSRLERLQRAEPDEVHATDVDAGLPGSKPEGFSQLKPGRETTWRTRIIGEHDLSSKDSIPIEKFPEGMQENMRTFDQHGTGRISMHGAKEAQHVLGERAAASPHVILTHARRLRRRPGLWLAATDPREEAWQVPRLGICRGVRCVRHPAWTQLQPDFCGCGDGQGHRRGRLGAACQR